MSDATSMQGPLTELVIEEHKSKLGMYEARLNLEAEGSATARSLGYWWPREIRGLSPRPLWCFAAASCGFAVSRPVSCQLPDSCWRQATGRGFGACRSLYPSMCTLLCHAALQSQPVLPSPWPRGGFRECC